MSLGNSLVVQWLGPSAFTAGGPGLTPGQGTKIPHASSQPKTKSQSGHLGISSLAMCM